MNGAVMQLAVTARIDPAEEPAHYRHGGILPQVYRELTAAAALPA